MFATLFPTLASFLNRKIILVYLFFYIAAAFFSFGYHHVDEHFQILEFLGWKIDIPAVLTWELGAHIRPALQPSLAYLFYQVGEWFYGIKNVNPFHLTVFLRFFTVFLHTLTLFFFLEPLLKFLSPQSRKYVIWLSIIIWFFPYMAVRYSSENYSRIFFLLSFSLPLWWESLKKEEKNYQHWTQWIWFISGVIAGLAFFFRFQIALMVVGFFAWSFFVKKESWKYLAIFTIGVLFTCVANILIDYWFYQEWVLTPWNYFNVNIFQGKANSFGINPWYDYFIKAVGYNIPFFPIYTIIPVLFFILYPRHVLSWIVIPFLLVHLIIGHKELRFLFPLISFLPFFIILVLDKWKWWNHPGKLKRGLVKYFLITNMILLFFGAFRPADFSTVYFFKYLYDKHRGQTVFYFNHPQETSDSYRLPQTLLWYVDNKVDYFQYITNTDHLLSILNHLNLRSETSPQFLEKPFVLVSPTSLVLDNEMDLSAEWKGKNIISLPQWEYSFPFKNIHGYPTLYRLWVDIASLPVVHIYSWKP